ncbi:MAG: energy transducer TonB [Gammaproteobacteria bacterium]|nr:energy transducer TonB [Gammaproteobacteria bacterium]
MNETQQLPARVKIGANDRLGFTLFVALTLHIIFILGVGFTRSAANQAESIPSMDIILANTESVEQPDEADYLAQSNQKGGGNQEEKARPGAPISAPTPLNQQGLSDRMQNQQVANEIKLERIYYINQREAKRKIAHRKNSDSSQNKNSQKASTQQRQLDIASLQAEILKITQAYAKRPREIALTASTKEAVEAGYLAQWVSKIEHIGNLNYPAEAEVKKIRGSLRLNVRINANGRIIDIKISRASGYPILDQAAKRIVHLAGPFAPFPAKLRDKADQIVIVRTWEFNSNKFTTNGNDRDKKS